MPAERDVVGRGAVRVARARAPRPERAGPSARSRRRRGRCPPRRRRGSGRAPRGSRRGGPRTGRACFGVHVPRPSVSVMTWIWPEQPAPAPMPMVGMRSRSVMASASWPGTSSRTIAKAPASWTASASASSARACSRLLPWTRTLRRGVLIACGVSPMWPMTGIPARTSASMVRADPDAALDLDCLHAGLAQEPAGVGDRVVGRGVGQERHVADDQRALACPGPRPSCGGASPPSSRGRWCRSRASPGASESPTRISGMPASSTSPAVG